MVLGLLRRLEDERQVKNLAMIGPRKRCMVRACGPISPSLSRSHGWVVLRSLSHEYMVIRDFRRDRRYKSWAVISHVRPWTEACAGSQDRLPVADLPHTQHALNQVLENERSSHSVRRINGVV